MATPPPQPPARSGMSLYANLLDTDGSASISRDPVRFKDDKADAPARKAIDPALRFQPIRRPQINKPSTKPKPAFPKPPSTASIPPSQAPPPPPTDDPPPAPIPQPRATLADWAADDDNDHLYAASAAAAAAAEKRQRGGRRNKNKKNRKGGGGGDFGRETDWDELYDPARPTNVEEYLRSEERVREVREWRGVLYARRWREEDEDGRVTGRSGSDGEEGSGRGLRNQFAPPPSFNFAPPPMSPPRAAAATIPDDTTGDDAYARRLALSGMAPPPPPPQPAADTTTSTISRAPIRYTQPPNPSTDTDTDAMDIDTDPNNPNNPTPDGPEGSEGPSSRPGQQGFAQRLMAKYGWTKGSGLGASSTGITTALRVQVEKRKRRSDAEGGGFVPGGARGRVIAPKGKSQSQSQSSPAESGGGSGGNGKFGPTSVVIVLDHMLDNMPDLEAEVEDAGLGQEIGEECGERYGRVERLVVDIEGRRVLIRFVEAVSALRAVNALEGRVFNGNTIVARFYDEEKFEEGIYDG